MARPATGQTEWRKGKAGLECWHVRVTLSTNDRPWVPLPGIPREDEAAAVAMGQTVSARMRKRGAVKESSGETVSEWFNRWTKERKEHGLATVEDERGRFAKWIEPVIGPLEMTRVTSANVESIVAALDLAVRKERIAWKTALNVWGIVTKMFDDAAHGKVLALKVRDKSNPAKDVRGPDRGSERSKPFLRPEELVALLSCAEVPLYRRHVYAVAVYTGARVSELRAIMPSDVSFDTMQLTIAKQHDGKKASGRTKTGRARYPTLEAALFPLLKALVADPEGRAGRLVRVPHESECSWQLREDLQTAGCKREDLYADDEMRAPIVFHNLRHTCGVHMAVRRDAPQDIQWRLGHSTAAMSEKYSGEARYAAGPKFGQPFPPLPLDLLRSAGEFRHRSGFPGDSGPKSPGKVASPTGFEPVLAK